MSDGVLEEVEASETYHNFERRTGLGRRRVISFDLPFVVLPMLGTSHRIR
jgi:hypothetical protein